MKKINYYIASVFISIVLLSACSDCPISEQPPVFVCNVREGTISEFNPRLIQWEITPDSVYLEPVPRYSIHTFEFPINNSSSGNLPNDERYETSEKIAITDPIPFSNGDNYYAALVDYYPLNSTMIGDVMVVYSYIDGGNPLNSSAELKFYGSLARFPNDFFSENSDEFCDFISAYSEAELDDIRASSNRFGAYLPNAREITYDADSNFVAVDENGVINEFKAITQEDKKTLQDKANGQSILVRVKIGEVYFYRARNGGQFVFVVADIRPGTQPPNKNRVTLMFNPLK